MHFGSPAGVGSFLSENIQAVQQCFVLLCGYAPQKEDEDK